MHSKARHAWCVSTVVYTFSYSYALSSKRLGTAVQSCLCYFRKYSLRMTRISLCIPVIKMRVALHCSLVSDTQATDRVTYLLSTLAFDATFWFACYFVGILILCVLWKKLCGRGVYRNTFHDFKVVGILWRAEKICIPCFARADAEFGQSNIRRPPQTGYNCWIGADGLQFIM